MSARLVYLRLELKRACKKLPHIFTGAIVLLLLAGTIALLSARMLYGETSSGRITVGVVLPEGDAVAKKALAMVSSLESVKSICDFEYMNKEECLDKLKAGKLYAVMDAARRIGAVVLSDECYALMDWRSVRRNTAASSAPAASASAASVPAAPVAESNEPASDTAFSLSATPCALNPHVCEGSAAGILVLYSLSKQSNMAGYRTALIAGDYRLVKEMAEYRKQIGQIIPGPVQAAMAAGLKDTAAVHEQWRRYRRRLSALVDALKAYGYSAQMPSGALYVWVKAKSGDCWADMAELAKIGIIPSPGEFYGAPAYLRFSATATDEAIRSACERLTA